MRILDRFDKGLFLVVEGNVSNNDTFLLDGKWVRVVDLVPGMRDRTGVQIEYCEKQDDVVRA